MALRGIAEGKGALLLHPMQSLEYILMPLLMNGNNVAQDLSVAALTKGIGLPGTHTCMTELHLTVWDFIYPALCTLPLLWKGVYCCENTGGKQQCFLCLSEQHRTGVAGYLTADSAR